MALVQCRECKHDVSTEAPTCPHCGVKYPAAFSGRQSQAPIRVKGKAILAAIGVAVIIVAVGGAKKDGLSNSVATKQAEPNPYLSCAGNYKMCSGNLDLVQNFRGWSDARTACRSAADNSAKYGTPEWPWSPFQTFVRGSDYIDSGIAVAIEEDAKFSNGFGAMARVRVVCKYDLNAGRVIDVSIKQR